MGSASTVGSVAAAVAPAAVPEVVVAARAVWVSAVVSAEPEELADQVNKGQERRSIPRSLFHLLILAQPQPTPLESREHVLTMTVEPIELLGPRDRNGAQEPGQRVRRPPTRR
jgi:hypothetical protein